MEIRLTESQQAVLDSAGTSSIFLEGPPGSGKSTVAAAFTRRLAEQGVPAQNILILLPQRTLAEPFYQVVHSTTFQSGGIPQIVTLSGLSRRMVTLYWPVIAASAGFQKPDQPPRFLNHETSQFYTALVVRPLLEKGFFDSVTLPPSRLYTQILNNLSKSATTGIPYTEIGERLKSAWSGRPEQLRVYDEVQICINNFRQYCLDNNLLDFSLTVETFRRQLWDSAPFRDYFYQQFRCLIYDNMEEDVPVTHDLVREWLPHMDQSFLVYDTGGGYRVFLGADAESAYTLKQECPVQQTLSNSFVKSPQVAHLQQQLSNVMLAEPSKPDSAMVQAALRVETRKYYPEMIDWVSREVNRLIREEGVSPDQICIVSPFLSDALRFELSIQFEDLKIPFATHRPSRSIKEEAAAGCLITLTKLLHPEWRMPISIFEFRSMLMQAITGFDLIRADVLTNIIYRTAVSGQDMPLFNDLPISTQDRISFVIGERYDQLREFIQQYRDSVKPPLDTLLTILFSELLSRPGFGFHTNLDAAATISHLIESYNSFYHVYVESLGGQTELAEPESTFIDTIQQGVLPAQYLDSAEDTERAVFLSPAHSFLMANRPVDYQFWLDIGSIGWWQTLNQPLTQPYVLSRDWDPTKKWTDSDEFETSNTGMYRIINGLLNRCGRQVTACIVEIDEQGNEQRGPLLKAIQGLLRSAARAGLADDDADIDEEEG